MKKYNCLKSVGIILGISLLLFAIVPLILEHLIFRNNVYSALTNGEWSSFLGSYIGGILGGAGTLIAMYVTRGDTRLIQEENINQLKADRLRDSQKERKQFTDGLAQDISMYIANISNFFYACRHEARLTSDKDHIVDELDDIRSQIQSCFNQQKKLNIDTQIEEYNRIDISVNELRVREAKAESRLQRIEKEIDSNRVDRSVANEHLFILKIKLKNITEAQSIINKLDYIHKNSGNSKVSFDFIEKETEQLLDLTVAFINYYINANI